METRPLFKFCPATKRLKISEFLNTELPITTKSFFLNLNSLLPTYYINSYPLGFNSTSFCRYFFIMALLLSSFKLKEKDLNLSGITVARDALRDEAKGMRKYSRRGLFVLFKDDSFENMPKKMER